MPAETATISRWSSTPQQELPFRANQAREIEPRAAMHMMRIAIDVHMLGEQHAGVATYARELALHLYRSLHSNTKLTLELLGKPEHKEVLERLFAPHPQLRYSYIKGKRAWTSFHLPRWLF